MTFSEYILPLSRYLHSIRMVKEGGTTLFVIDLRFPAKWEVMKLLTTPEETASVTLQKDGEDVKVYSFFVPFTFDAIDPLYEKAISIINRNVEMDKKRKLLHQKLQELKKQFEEQVQQLKTTFDSTPLNELEQPQNVVNEEESPGT